MLKFLVCPSYLNCFGLVFCTVPVNALLLRIIRITVSYCRCHCFSPNPIGIIVLRSPSLLSFLNVFELLVLRSLSFPLVELIRMSVFTALVNALLLRVIRKIVFFTFTVIEFVLDPIGSRVLRSPSLPSFLNLFALLLSSSLSFLLVWLDSDYRFYWPCQCSDAKNYSDSCFCNVGVIAFLPRPIGCFVVRPTPLPSVLNLFELLWRLSLSFLLVRIDSGCCFYYPCQCSVAHKYSNSFLFCLLSLLLHVCPHISEVLLHGHRHCLHS